MSEGRKDGTSERQAGPGSGDGYCVGRRVKLNGALGMGQVLAGSGLSIGCSSLLRGCWAMGVNLFTDVILPGCKVSGGRREEGGRNAI